MGVQVFTKPLVEATYQLESDVPLSLFAFETIDRVAIDIKERFPTLEYPELQTTVADLCASDPEYRKALLDDVKSVLIPAKDYFHVKIIVELTPQLNLFEVAALTNLQYMQRTDPFVADVEATLWMLVQRASAIVDADGVAKLVAELTTYRQRVSNVRWKADITGTCYTTKAAEVRLFEQRERLMQPSWHGFMSVVAIIASSYVSVDRAFSIFKLVFGDQQTRSLQGLSETFSDAAL
ncbi:unnamed protein product [Phaeothamnion confervicola]